MSKGYMGRILWVDLSKGTFHTEHLDDALYEQFLGGYGLAAKVIFDRQKPRLSAFHPDNILAMMSGLLTNGRAIFNGRWMLAGKSPLTGTWGDANCGGDLAPAIKESGFDGIFFIGKSEKPVYLLIDGKKMELRDASALWGILDAVETENRLRAVHGDDFRAACIGAGGERRSLIAGVVNGKGRLAARSGLGALMGSKNLKAVCLRGDHQTGCHDEAAVWQHTTQFLTSLETDLNDFGKKMKQAGTAGTLTDSTTSGDSPLLNWQGVPADFPAEKANKIDLFSVTRYETRKYHCYGCPFGCGGLCMIPDEPLLKETHRPEYETICGFGAQLLNDNIESIFMVNELLNRAGIDTISCATTVNWAFEAYAKGILTQEDTDGLELTWGNHGALVALVQKIVAGEGIGAILANGVKKSAEHFGGEELAAPMHVHGQELPMHDSRSTSGGLDLGVGYETEPTPGRHTATFAGWDQYKHSDHPKNRLFDKFRLKSRYEKPVDDDHEKQGERLRGASCAEDIINGAGLCNFGFYLGPAPPLVEWLNATTGWRKTFDDYLLVGQRIKTVRHAFNIREGLEVAEIRMPERARGNPPLTTGPNAYSGNVLAWDDAKKDYYRAMGWDEITGRPLRETLRSLELPEVEKALYGE
ncbi:aldehyde:ferredoxin oxidoreductase, bis-(molybdopterin)-oxotungsten-containing [Geotalea daltonii FRC-32]|uniref:Aldehyde:ferredoxin oxidoreductase, bis-(Molybdopterin)-oxotungsten-containing n=1 Tax=Geotalea daltonii (strain DSM 22248 / JCM 15807 / FRC-32) TaxID=316067 RepID=B9M4R8_GEODF|nr:aldehyde ferredoxin oxidoreductase C-terminal domain-containing protein [Geotalea daltonii]ACM21602.1 aldehyde:ferredoxin oxidoreductase, bis-(molybdopterin)-oxotungsten-containing [Geotalea daltonii FRC-32]